MEEGVIQDVLSGAAVFVTNVSGGTGMSSGTVGLWNDWTYWAMRGI